MLRSSPSPCHQLQEALLWTLIAAPPVRPCKPCLASDCCPSRTHNSRPHRTSDGIPNVNPATSFFLVPPLRLLPPLPFELMDRPSSKSFGSPRKFWRRGTTPFIISGALHPSEQTLVPGSTGIHAQVTVAPYFSYRMQRKGNSGVSQSTEGMSNIHNPFLSFRTSEVYILQDYRHCESSLSCGRTACF